MAEPVFENLPFHPATARWFQNRFEKPSPAQVKGWPAIASGENTLILAPTGSGKTLAAFLWCIDELFRAGFETDAKVFAENARGVHTLYISPLKALNNDIHVNLQEPLKGIKKRAAEMGFADVDIRAAVRTGDTPPHLRQAMVKHPPHILITTPESLYLLLTSVRGRTLFHNLRYLIVDEIHALSNNKRGVHLSLSLERLSALCQNEPIRIGLSATQRPLERIAAFLGGQTFSLHSGRIEPRAVKIVDCGQRKDMDLAVISPVKDFTDLPDATVWPKVIEKLYQLITSHQSTLVFVNMRAQAEKVARQLNEMHRQASGDADAFIALAHHGSISRHMRYDIEARLKNGEIPAVIATASLELGIDIGSINLVVQLESPKSITAALQRVGRSGHLLRTTSKGRIIPLYQADLDDAASITQCMFAGDIEETVVPENCLDVLVQQIVAEVAMRDWLRSSLYNLVRRSYCYRHLSEDAFNSVVEMLSGRFADAELRALRPLITWDKVNDRLIARRGSRLLAVMNGGTIADRGYYSIYLLDGKTRIGEIEEEFVFESRVGDVFFLGNNEWRINEITRDRILVSPLSSHKPRAPFWKGDPFFRDYSTSQKVGLFRREAADHIENGDFDHWMEKTSHADQDTTANLLHYFQRQIENTRLMPTDKKFILEFFRDAADEPQLVLHAAVGGRITGAWAIALAAALEKRFNIQVQYSYNDDGLIIRLLDVVDPPPLENLFRLSAEEMEQFLIDSLINTPLFAVRFRHNATRSLLLQRSGLNKRIPLWLQRLRAADLMQAVSGQPDFPVLIETYRECLQDVFDVRSFREVVEKVRNREIEIKMIETPHPSPFASGLIFRFLAENLYQEDRTRAPGYAAQVSSELLADILSREIIPTIVTREIVKTAEAFWLHLAPNSCAKDVEDLFAIIAQLGPIKMDALPERSRQNPQEWIKKLKDDGRIIYLENEWQGWIASGDAKLFAVNPSPEQIGERVRRFLKTHGPKTFVEIRNFLNLTKEQATTALTHMLEEKEVVRGKLTLGVDGEQWCDRQNFSFLYRKAIAERRRAAAPADKETFYRFLLSWHKTADAGQSVLQIAQRYSGHVFAVNVFEREILCSRISAPDENFLALTKEMEGLVARGDIIVYADRNKDAGRLKIHFIPRREGHQFYSKAAFAKKAEMLPQTDRILYDFLQENGASQIRDLSEGTGLTLSKVENSLMNLAKMSLVSCDNYRSFLLMLQPNHSPNETKTGKRWSDEIRPSWVSKHPVRVGFRPSRHKMREHIRRHGGRWFLTGTFAAFGKEVDEQKQAEQQAHLLLNRYGILVKEFYRRESGLVPWYHIFQVLKKMEWSGEIRRGYFIKGLSGVQFALPGAVEFLQKLHSGTHAVVQKAQFISTVDPALPFGGAMDWDIRRSDGVKMNIARMPSNHLLFVNARPMVYSENFGNRLWMCGQFKADHLLNLIDALKTWLKLPEPLRPRKKIEIAFIDETPAAKGPFAPDFVRNGFETDGNKLVLWPSAL